MNFPPIIYEWQKPVEILHTKDTNTALYVVNIGTYPFVFKA